MIVLFKMVRLVLGGMRLSVPSGSNSLAELHTRRDRWTYDIKSGTGDAVNDSPIGADFDTLDPVAISAIRPTFQCNLSVMDDHIVVHW